MKAYIELREDHQPYATSVMRAKFSHYHRGKLRRQRVYEQITQSSIERINALGEPLIEMTTDGFVASYIFRHPRFKVYYARDPRFFDSGTKYGPPPYTIETLAKTHEFICTIEAESLEDIMRQMQGENWEPHGNILASILSLEKPHTSMSVNDVIRDPNGDYYECLVSGWGKLE